MPRGGKRKGAGRKALWNSGKTKAVKLPELLIPEIVEFAKVIDSTLVDGLYGREKVEDLDRLVDILFEEVNYSDVLERIAKKLLILSASEDTATQTSSAIQQPSLVHVAINDKGFKLKKNN